MIYLRRPLSYEGSTETSLLVLTYPGKNHRQARQHSLVRVLRTFSIVFVEHVMYTRLSRKSYRTLRRRH